MFLYVCALLNVFFSLPFFQPPIGGDRVAKLGEWVKKEFRVSGNVWDSSSVDIAASGLGWFAIGLKGEAQLGVWTYDGVDVVVRNALLPYRAHNFEVAGFSVSEIVSRADRTKNKHHSNEKKRRLNDTMAIEFAPSSTVSADTAPNST